MPGPRHEGLLKAKVSRSPMPGPLKETSQVHKMNITAGQDREIQLLQYPAMREPGVRSQVQVVRQGILQPAPIWQE